MSYKKIALLAGLVFVVGCTYYLYGDFHEVGEQADQLNSMPRNMHSDGSSENNSENKSEGFEGLTETNSQIIETNPCAGSHGEVTSISTALSTRDNPTK